MAVRIPSCHPDRPHKARGLCRPCYDGQDGPSIRRARHFKAWYSNTPEIQSSRKKEWRGKNVERSREGNKRWRTQNPEKTSAMQRRSWLKSNYGLSEQEFNLRLEQQGARCCICQINTATCVDHNHDTGKTRGLLCSGCNSGLGFFKENVIALVRAKHYLEFWSLV